MLLILIVILAAILVSHFLCGNDKCKCRTRTTEPTEQELFVYFLYRNDLWWMFQGRINNGMLTNYPAEQWVERMQVFKEDGQYWSRMNLEWKKLLKNEKK